MIADNALKVSVRRVWRYESPTTGQDDKECVDAVSTIAQDAPLLIWKSWIISRLLGIKDLGTGQ